MTDSAAGAGCVGGGVGAGRSGAGDDCCGSAGGGAAAGATVVGAAVVGADVAGDVVVGASVVGATVVVRRTSTASSAVICSCKSPSSDGRRASISPAAKQIPMAAATRIQTRLDLSGSLDGVGVGAAGGRPDRVEPAAPAAAALATTASRLAPSCSSRARHRSAVASASAVFSPATADSAADFSRSSSGRPRAARYPSALRRGISPSFTAQCPTPSAGPAHVHTHC